MCIDFLPAFRAPLPSLAQLKSMSADSLLSLVQSASVDDLRTLWDIAGIEEPPDIELPDFDGDEPLLLALEYVRPARDWYFPLDVLEAICSRLPEYADPIEEPPPTIVCDRPLRASILAQRRGEGQPHDSPEARANPLVGCSLWSRDDFRDREGHLQREVSRARNGSVVVGKVTVAGRRA